jgi:hypothetical protein
VNLQRTEIDMRTLATFTALLAAVLVLAPAGSAQEIQIVQSEPAWCGGSWEPTSVQEVVDDKGTVTRAPVGGTGGTNFAPCMPIVRSVKRMVENVEREETVSIPTHPAHPAVLVTFQLDEKTGEMVGGRVITRKDPVSGEEVARWEPIPPAVIKAKE